MSRTFGVGPCVLAGFKNSSGDCVIYGLRFRSTQLIPDLVKEFENETRLFILEEFLDKEKIV